MDLFLASSAVGSLDASGECWASDLRPPRLRAADGFSEFLTFSSVFLCFSGFSVLSGHGFSTGRCSFFVVFLGFCWFSGGVYGFSLERAWPKEGPVFLVVTLGTRTYGLRLHGKKNGERAVPSRKSVPISCFFAVLWLDHRLVEANDPPWPKDFNRETKVCFSSGLREMVCCFIECHLFVSTWGWLLSEEKRKKNSIFSPSLSLMRTGRFL